MIKQIKQTKLNKISKEEFEKLLDKAIFSPLKSSKLDHSTGRAGKRFRQNKIVDTSGRSGLPVPLVKTSG